MKTRILLMDDDTRFRGMIESLLVQAGCAVTSVSDGAKGVARLAAETFDLVLTDIFMPEQDGIETIVRVRQAYPGLPIIAISGGGYFEEAEDYLRIAERLGAAKVLVKPFSRDELLSAIADVCPAQ
jgi:CheY-like chemotaxis protein